MAMANTDNLGDIVQQVEDELQFAPDLLKHRRDIRRVVNRVYQNLCGEENWSFLKKEVPFVVLPDVPVPAASWVGVVGHAMTVNIASGTDPFETYFYSDTDDDAALQADLLELLVNAEWTHNTTLPLATAAGVDYDFEIAPYEVERVTGTDGNLLIVYLDPRAIGTVEGTTVDSKFIFNRWRMPVDCAKVLRISDEATGNDLEPWTQAHYRDKGLVERVGEPSIYLVDAGFRSAKSTVAMDPTKTVASMKNRWIHSNRNEPYRHTLWTVTAASGGSLRASHTYRVMLAWSYRGRFSPASEVKEVTTTASNLTIDLAGVLPYEDVAGGSSGLNGRELTVWVAEQESAFYYAARFEDAQMATTPLATINIDKFIPGGHYNGSDAFLDPWEDQVRWDEVYPGEYQYLRFYPRPDKKYVLNMHYIKRPRQLIEDIDEPEMEKQYRSILVHRVIMQLGSRHEGQTLKLDHAAMDKSVTKRLRARYLTPIELRMQKGRIDQAHGHRPFRSGDVPYEGP